MKLTPRSQQPVRSGVLPPRHKLVSGVFSIAALFLATGAAHAADQQWWPDCRHGWVTRHFENFDTDWPPVEISPDDGNDIIFSAQAQPPDNGNERRVTVRITHDELRTLLKDLPKMMPVLKACWAYRKCLDDREAGKVKHCYYNDRRWRDFFGQHW
jgi:hypothetical protein